MDFKINQDVVNPTRPEWGIGKILAVEPGPGGQGLRVRVRFPGAGPKTIALPPGRLAPPESVPAVQKPGENPDDEQTRITRLCRIPEIIMDRRASLETRVEELVKLFRFDNHPKSIFDWAVMRLGDKDPLGEFTADELHEHFAEFSRRRNRALHAIAQETRRAGLEMQFLTLLDRTASPDVREKIRRVLASNPL